MKMVERQVTNSWEAMLSKSEDDNKALRAQLTEAREKTKRLEEALEPFAEVIEEIEDRRNSMMAVALLEDCIKARASMNADL